jgi:ABC-type sulfate transport system permease subunit
MQAFASGLGPFWGHITEPDFLQSVKMTLLLAAIAVPVNTVFGVLVRPLCSSTCTGRGSPMCPGYAEAHTPSIHPG